MFVTGQNFGGEAGVFGGEASPPLWLNPDSDDRLYSNIALKYPWLSTISILFLLKLNFHAQWKHTYFVKLLIKHTKSDPFRIVLAQFHVWWMLHVCPEKLFLYHYGVSLLGRLALIMWYLVYFNKLEIIISFKRMEMYHYHDFITSYIITHWYVT